MVGSFDGLSIPLAWNFRDSLKARLNIPSAVAATYQSQPFSTSSLIISVSDNFKVEFDRRNCIECVYEWYQVIDTGFRQIESFSSSFPWQSWHCLHSHFLLLASLYFLAISDILHPLNNFQ